jgi:hypothetical protein
MEPADADTYFGKVLRGAAEAPGWAARRRCGPDAGLATTMNYIHVHATHVEDARWLTDPLVLLCCAGRVFGQAADEVGRLVFGPDHGATVGSAG